MRGSITDTIEDLGCQAQIWLEVEIQYFAWPGEPMVRYDRNGDGYPGSDPGCELTGVIVTSWGRNDTREPDKHWLWEYLDKIAAAYIENHWDIYGDLCLEDAAEQTETY